MEGGWALYVASELMRPRRGYYGPDCTTDTDSTQRGNSCCAPAKKLQ